MQTIYDVLVIGSGITGCATARELSRYNASVLVLDRGSDLAEGATKANSGIVHAGYDAVPGTKKALYNVRGANMYAGLAGMLGVPYLRCGASVLAFDEEDKKTIISLKERGQSNGVAGLEILNHDVLMKLEPNLNPEVSAALSVPTSAIVSPYEMAFAMADDASLNGVRFFFRQKLIAVYRTADGKWEIKTDTDEAFCCKVFVNCAGSSGADIHNMISAAKLRMTHRRGQYYLLDRMKELPFSRTVFQCPSPMGKGVLVSPTVHGNLLIGPNAEDVPDPEDTSTTQQGLDEVYKKAFRTWPGISVRLNITNFSGVRAHLETDDFLIGAVPEAPGAFEAIGIESPGLSSAPAIAADLAAEIVFFLDLKKKETTVPYHSAIKPFRDMTDEEKETAVRRDSAYGNIVCRCETITEAEIVQAIRRPVGAKTIDGVKRRTRAGMGRCQGGFCCPRVAQIISEETGIPLSEVTKDGGNSLLLSGTIESFLKGDVDHE